MKPEEFFSKLELALKEYRFADVGKLIDEIAPTDFNEKQLKKAMNLVRRKRLFKDLERMTAVFSMAGQKYPVVRRQYAQALLDQNRIEQALGTLEGMLPEVKSDPKEGSEVQGLIGRAYKQLYVNEDHSENLVKAIDSYSPYWKSRQGDYHWHGINLVACLARAKRDGVDPKTDLDSIQIAKDIRDEIEESSAGYVWDYGTAVEASVALDDEKAALEWAGKYVKHPDADAFELGSTLRQLKELWELESTELGQKLLPVLEYAALQCEGSVVQPVAKKFDRSGFEAVWGNESYTYFNWLDTMYQRCLAIVRVFDFETKEAQGTGFVVPGDWLNPKWGPAPVVITNSHVVSLNQADEAPLRPEDTCFEFTRIPGRPTAAAGPLLFSSPRVELDVTVLRVQPPDGTATLVPSDYLPIVPEAGKQPQRLYVIGHPDGGELAVALYDNSLVRYEGAYVQYRSPTEGGHSGSPVFTRQLKLIAVHHRARQELQVNEGICMQNIRSACSVVPWGERGDG